MVAAHRNESPERRGEVVVRGVPVRYAVTGQGEQDALLVHGSGAHRWWWYPIVPLLVDAGLRVITLDLSGHGDSGHRTEYDGEVWREEMFAVLAATQSRRPVVVGHSLGGRLVLLTATTFPEMFAGVVMLDTPLRPPPSYRAAVAGRLHRIPRERRYSSREQIVARFRLFPPQPHPPADVMHILAINGVREVDGMWTWKHDQGGFPAFYGPELLVAAASIRLPLCYIYGACSALVSDDESEFVRTRLPADVQVVRVAGGHHHVGLDRPAECATAIIATRIRAD